MSFVRMLPRLLRIRRSTTATAVPSRRWYERTLPRTAAAGAAIAMTLGTAIASCRLGKQIGDEDDGGEQTGVWHRLSHEEELARALPEDHPDTVQVRRIAGDLIAAARDDEVFGKRRLSERTGHPVDARDADQWKVPVIDHDEAYAFCYDNHDDIVVSTALLDELCRKDAFVATVLGREVEHMMAWHGMKMLPRYLLVSVFANREI